MVNAHRKLLGAALAYSQRFELEVFPCRPGGKEPLSAHGCKDASKDRSVIERWWKLNPGANVAIATGEASGTFVLDRDDRYGGDASFEAFELEHNKLPETPIVLTPGSGLHYYFRLPKGVQIRNSASVLGPGLDVRGEGGYVIAPPSVHPNGNVHRWEAASRIDEVAFADPPDWLLHLILTPQSTPRRASSSKQGPSCRIDFARLAVGIPDGERDMELFRLACSLRRRGYNRELAERTVLDAAARCKPPFPEREAKRKVASAWRYA